MKKFLALMLALVTVFTVAACGNGDDNGDDETTDLDHLEAARDRLVLSVERDNVKNDVDLPDELGNYPDVEIAWESDNTDVIANDGTVTRPDPGDGNANVTLTATLTYNDEEVTRDYALTVIEDVEQNLFTDFSILYDRDSDDAPSMDDIVTIQGVVTSRWSGGVFLYDGETHFGIYDAYNFDIQDQADVGDELEYTGVFAKYNTLFQLTERDDYEVLDEDVSYDMPVHESSIEDMHDYDAGGEDKDVHGQHFKIQGLITKDDDDYYYIEDPDSDLDLSIYEYSVFDGNEEPWEDTKEALDEYIGEVVELEVVYYTDHSQDGILVVFQGGPDDIEVVEQDEEGQLNTDISNLEDTWTDGEDVTLPSEGGNGTTFSGWTSSNTDVLADDGTFVAAPNELSTITFTATAELGDHSKDATIDVDVLGDNPMSTADVLSSTEGEHVHTQGVVYSIFDGGYFIYDGTTPFAVYGSDKASDVEIGDEVELYGPLGSYNTLYQMTGNIKVEEVVAQGETVDVPVDTDKTIADIVAMDDPAPEIHGSYYELTGTLTTDGDDYFLENSDGDSVEIYSYSNADSYALLEDYVDDEITITLQYYTLFDGGPAMAFDGTTDDISVVE